MTPAEPRSPRWVTHRCAKRTTGRGGNQPEEAKPVAHVATGECPKKIMRHSKFQWLFLSPQQWGHRHSILYTLFGDRHGGQRALDSDGSGGDATPSAQALMSRP